MADAGLKVFPGALVIVVLRGIGVEESAVVNEVDEIEAVVVVGSDDIIARHSLAGFETFSAEMAMHGLSAICNYLTDADRPAFRGIPRRATDYQ